MEARQELEEPEQKMNKKPIQKEHDSIVKPKIVKTTAKREKESERQTTGIEELEKVFDENLLLSRQNDSLKFYLVGGSFKEQENAETYLQTLKEKGFEPFHMGKYGNFFVVGIGKYNTEDEAMAAKDQYLEENPGSGVWILER